MEFFFYDTWTEETIDLNKPTTSCDYRKWKHNGNSLDKITHFENHCKSGLNPCKGKKSSGVKHVTINPLSKFGNNNCLKTELKTKEFADALQQWINTEDKKKTDKRFIKLFGPIIFQ